MDIFSYVTFLVDFAYHIFSRVWKKRRYFHVIEALKRVFGSMGLILTFSSRHLKKLRENRAALISRKFNLPS